MTIKQLKRYRAIIKRIDYLAKRLWEISDRELTTVAGKVKGSSSEFPYTSMRFDACMDEPIKAQRRQEQIKRYAGELRECNGERRRIEEFIGRIPDLALKEIFQYYFLDGMTQQAIADLVNLERSRISRRISDYLQNSTQSTN